MSGASGTCANCGIMFCLPWDVERQRRQDHGTFYCPSGHANYYPQMTDEERTIKNLRKELRQAEALSTRFRTRWQETHAVALQCPTQCGWSSGAGIERVHRSIRRHLSVKHGITLPDLSAPDEEAAAS